MNKLYVVAALPHLWRCLRDLKCAVQEVNANIVVFECPEIYDYCIEGEWFADSEWFCQDSTQKYTRTEEAWQKRDRILKKMPFFLYRLVAN